MTTCPNCRYELSPGATECPMCSTALEHPARRRSVLIPAAAAAVVLILLAAGVLVATRNRTGPVPGASAAGVRQISPCRAPKAPAPKKETFVNPGSTSLDPSKTWQWVLNTNCGRIVVDLAVGAAPQTASSVAFLTEKNYYDGLSFHRVVPGFVIQGGDPSGDGTGGPGYTVTEAPPADLRYTRGVVAMAKRQTEPAGASGSQFFIVTGADVGLPPEYAFVGRVTAGMDVVAKIERSQTRVLIESASIRQG